MDRNTRYEPVHEHHPAVESLPEHHAHWDDQAIQKEGVQAPGKEGVVFSLGWGQLKQRAAQLAQPVLPFWQQTAWPNIKAIVLSKRQLFAFATLTVCGIGPFVCEGFLTTGSNSVFFGRAFGERLDFCADGLGSLATSPLSGAEGFFVLDFTFDSLTFSTVKIIDVTWDIVVGRGAQMLAWGICYNVFSDALFRVIERHPVSYSAFFDICLHGPSWASLWTLLRDLVRTKSKRTWLLYFYMFWSIIYVVTLPIMLSAMTGYVNTSIAWVDLDDTDEIVQASQFERAYVTQNAGNKSFPTIKCVSLEQWDNYRQISVLLREYCDCRLPNGTITTYLQWSRSGLFPDLYSDSRNIDCEYNYPGQNGTIDSVLRGPLNCNITISPITIDGVNYKPQTVNGSRGYCYKDRGYYEWSLVDKTRCLPDTQNPSYQWGFSTMLSAVFTIAQFVWSFTMYAVWQDAQFGSNLVKGGYKMTPLRAAFALGAIAKQKTGLKSVELVRADEKRLSVQLFGSTSKKARQQGAEVDYGIFKEDGAEETEMVSTEESGLKHRRNVATPPES